jgi:hypothetical protein
MCFEKILEGIASRSYSPRALMGVGRREYFDVKYPMRIFVCDEVLLCERSDGVKIVGTQKCRIFIHLSLHYSLHFIAQLNLHHIIFINTFGFHIIIFHFIHFSIKSEFMIKY